jgi:hypothetical protein
MRLEQNRAGAYHFSPLAPLIARRARLIETTMGSRQCFRLRARTLPGSLPSSVHIDDQPGLCCPIEQAAGGSKRVAGQQILLKARSQVFHSTLIEGRKKTGKGRAMGQEVSTEQSHEGLGKWSKSFVKGQQGWLAGHRIANQDHDKIDEVILSKARTGEPHLLLDLFQDPRMREDLSKGCHFSQPERS